MSENIRKLLEGASSESKRIKKGENRTVSFSKKKIVRFDDGEQLSYYDGFEKYIVKFCGSESSTVIATRLLALAKNALQLEQQKTQTTQAQTQIPKKK